MSVRQRMCSILGALAESAKDRRQVTSKFHPNFDKLPGRQKMKVLKHSLRATEKYHSPGTTVTSRAISRDIQRDLGNERGKLGMSTKRQETMRRLARAKKSGMPLHK